MPGGTLRVANWIFKNGNWCGHQGLTYNANNQSAETSDLFCSQGGGSDFEFKTTGFHGVFFWSAGWFSKWQSWQGSV